MSAEIIRGDARNLPLSSASVDLIVTSPPFWSLRSYMDNGKHYDQQIGAESTPAEYIDSLLKCTREWMRVLKPTGSLWINLGDKYNAYNGNRGPGTIQSNDVRQSAPRGHGLDTKSVSAKSLIGLPWRYAIRCIDELGLILRAEVIWSKPNGLPESVTDRVRRSHEQWFHLVKSPRYFSSVDNIREPHLGGWGGRGNYATKMKVTPGQHAHGSLDSTMGNPLGKLPGSVWEIPTQPLKVPAELGVDHFAAFPMEWPRRIVQGWSPTGICTTCGEGRRPDHDGRRFNPSSGNVGALGLEREYNVTGEVCACAPYTDHPERYSVGSAWRRPAGGAEHGTAQGIGRNAAAAQRATQRAELGPVRKYHLDRWAPAPTRPAVVLDPFGGTGTTALLADSLGRCGISIDHSSDYCRLGRWRTTDIGQRAAALQVPKIAIIPDDQPTIFDQMD